MAAAAHPLAWWSLAACRGCDPGLFHPERGEQVTDEALAICAICPVTAECLADALASETKDRTFGVRGGLTGIERKALRRRP